MKKGLGRSARRAFACAGLAACGGGGGDDANKVTTYVDSNAAFAAFHTFAEEAAPADDAGTPSGVVANLESANAAATAQLPEHGLRSVTSSDQADLMWFSLATTEASGARSWSCLPGAFYGTWPFAFSPCAGLAPVYRHYQANALLVGLVDATAQAIVLSGLIPDVPEVGAGGESSGRIDQGVADVLSAYPGSAVKARENDEP